MHDSDARARDEVLSFWFPEGHGWNIVPEIHRRHWRWRLHGGADAQVIERFSNLTENAAVGILNHWAECAKGRLALIILLDQFPRSLWRDTPRAFAQDPAALALTLDGLENGAYGAMPTAWHKITFTQPLGHTEGPDHLARIDRLIILREEIAAKAPPLLQPIYRAFVEQARKLREVIAQFGRHPHRDRILGRNLEDIEANNHHFQRSPHLGIFR